MEEAEIVAALRRPTAYGEAVDDAIEEVEHRETHISHLFFAGSRVFKLKKHVRFDFLDYGTLERRRHFCREEVRLNRRTAPRVYLGAVPISADGQGELRVEGPGRPVAWAVKMVRLPQDRMLENLLRESAPSDGLEDARVGALTDVLSDFHAEAGTGEGIDEHGTPEAVSAKVRGNLSEAGEFVGRDFLSPALHEFLSKSAETFLESRRSLLARRVTEGRIREGHGDLHASNICFSPRNLAPRGVTIYDCIEFSRPLRCGDVASDVAFLAMDLDRRGHARTSDRLVKRYVEVASDPSVVELLRFYKSYRAVIRAKVAALAARTATDDPDDSAPHAKARGYFQLAAAYALPPALLLTCGLPASGKSWLARRVAGSLGGVLLRSDITRKRLAGIDPFRSAAAPFQEGLYDERMTARTYDRMLERAASFLRQGRSVVVDASFADPERRAPFVALAAQEQCRFELLYVTAGEETVRRRLERREADSRSASDADLEVFLRARRTFQPPEELEPSNRREFRSERDEPAELNARILEDWIAQRVPRRPHV